MIRFEMRYEIVGISERIKCLLIMCFVCVFNRKFRIKKMFSPKAETPVAITVRLLYHLGGLTGEGGF
jgi:hypothetical protein